MRLVLMQISSLKKTSLLPVAVVEPANPIPESMPSPEPHPLDLVPIQPRLERPLVQILPTDELFLAYARRRGLSLQPLEPMRAEMMRMIARRLKARPLSGDAEKLGQSPSFALPFFPRDAATMLFAGMPLSRDRSTSSRLVEWEYTSRLTESMGTVVQLHRCDPRMFCLGQCRGLGVTPRNPFINSIAVVIPYMTVTWEQLRECGRLKVSFRYVIVDKDLEIHPPKQSNKRAVDLPPHAVASIKLVLFRALRDMAVLKYPLAASFLDYLGPEYKRTARLTRRMEAIVAGFGPEDDSVSSDSQEDLLESLSEEEGEGGG